MAFICSDCSLYFNGGSDYTIVSCRVDYFAKVLQCVRSEVSTAQHKYKLPINDESTQMLIMLAFFDEFDRFGGP